MSELPLATSELEVGARRGTRDQRGGAFRRQHHHCHTKSLARPSRCTAPFWNMFMTIFSCETIYTSQLRHKLSLLPIKRFYLQLLPEDVVAWEKKTTINDKQCTDVTINFKQSLI